MSVDWCDENGFVPPRKEPPMTDAVERLRDAVRTALAEGERPFFSYDDARAILDIFATLTARAEAAERERDAAIAREQRAVADVVAWLRNGEMDGGSNLTIAEAADAIEAGAHQAKGDGDVAGD
jgi:hypothetical protein